MPRRDKKKQSINTEKTNKQNRQRQTIINVKKSQKKPHRKLNNKQQGPNKKLEINASAPEGLAVLLHM